MTRLVLVLVASFSTWLAAQQPAFRTQTDLVTLGVTVVDRKGTFPADLASGDFEVFEDGTRQTVTFFARGDQEASAPELHVGLLLDTSGSMGQDIGLARSAAVKFLNTLSEAVDITLVDFDTEVRLAKYGQQDFPRLVERIRSRKPDGFTAFYDALGVYLDAAQEDDGRTILVVFTDGGDTRSALRFNELVTSIRASDVTIYTVGLLENQGGNARFEQRMRLEEIAAESGGRAFFPLAMKQIDDAYDKILAQIRSQYSLGYLSTNTRRDGTWRKVEVKVKRQGLGNLQVQARKGYFAPYQR
jgi:Ca-activated chloride channel family protein